MNCKAAQTYRLNTLDRRDKKPLPFIILPLCFFAKQPKHLLDLFGFFYPMLFERTPSNCNRSGTKTQSHTTTIFQPFYHHCAARNRRRTTGVINRVIHRAGGVKFSPHPFQSLSHHNTTVHFLSNPIMYHVISLHILSYHIGLMLNQSVFPQPIGLASFFYFRRSTAFFAVLAVYFAALFVPFFVAVDVILDFLKRRT